jgi:hypothetical protein
LPLSHLAFHFPIRVFSHPILAVLPDILRIKYDVLKTFAGQKAETVD